MHQGLHVLPEADVTKFLQQSMVPTLRHDQIWRSSESYIVRPWMTVVQALLVSVSDDLSRTYLRRRFLLSEQPRHLQTLM